MVTVNTSSAPARTNSEDQNVWIGVIAVAISCLSSGFAGVYFEKNFQRLNAVSVLRNVQLGIYLVACVLSLECLCMMGQRFGMLVSSRAIRR